MTLGMRVSPNNQRRPFGYWEPLKESLPTNELAAGLYRIDQELVNSFGRTLNNRFQEIESSRQTGQPPKIRSLVEWQAESKIRDAKIAEAKRARDKIDAAAFDLEISLRAFDYTKGDAAEAVRLGRLNDKFANMKAPEKKAAMKNSEFARAILYEPPEMTGLLPTEWQRLKEERIALRHPNEVKKLSEFKAAAEQLDLTIKTIEAAHQFEMADCKTVANSVPRAEDAAAYA